MIIPDAKTSPKTVEVLKKWVNRLNLNDWTIDFKDDCSPDDMILSDVDGETEYNETMKFAFIRILDAKYAQGRILPFNCEKTIIHELLHIKFCFLDKSGDNLYDRILHQLIEDMARVLYDVERKND